MAESQLPRCLSESIRIHHCHCWSMEDTSHLGLCCSELCMARLWTSRCLVRGDVGTWKLYALDRRSPENCMKMIRSGFLKQGGTRMVLETQWAWRRNIITPDGKWPLAGGLERLGQRCWSLAGPRGNCYQKLSVKMSGFVCCLVLGQCWRNPRQAETLETLTATSRFEPEIMRAVRQEAWWQIARARHTLWARARFVLPMGWFISSCDLAKAWRKTVQATNAFYVDESHPHHICLQYIYIYM
jgi:hypothetical protein